MAKLSANEKEKTKIRERNRRSITTKIFQGLRKYGGYNLAPRADINEVLRCLASEAGWTVEEDGTTYRTQQPGGSQGLRHTGSGGMSGGGSRALLGGGGIGAAPGMSGGGNLLGGNGGGSGLGGLVLGHGGMLASGGMAGLMAAATGGGLFSLQQAAAAAGLDVSGLLDARGGDCSTTASPRRQQTTSGSIYATPTPTSSISFIPSASPFASPASSEVVAPPYPSASASVSTALASGMPLVPAALYPSASAHPFSSIPYLPSSAPDLKDDLFDHLDTFRASGLPLDFCTSSASSLMISNTNPSPDQHHLIAATSRHHHHFEQEQHHSAASSSVGPMSSVILNAAQLGQARLSSARSSSMPPLMMLSQQVHPFLQESRASNHNTPLASPQRHG